MAYDRKTTDTNHLTHPSSSMSRRPDYEVFLSFRGPDTRCGFTDFLHTMLTNAGIRVFKDDEELERGEEINPQLTQAIEQSMISIPVISEGYGSSKSCLMELDQMLKCKDEKNHIIIPIFFHVEPLDVRHCTGPFQSAADEHRERGREGTLVNHWMSALRRIGALNGHHLQRNYAVSYSEVIKQIVHEVVQKLKKRDLTVPKQLVVVDYHVQETMAKLKVDCRNGKAVKIGDTCGKVLICGIPGVGKTVLAKSVYNQLHHLYDACSFLDKVQEEIRNHGIVSVQNRLITHIHKKNALQFDCSDHALTHIQTRFRTVKVLLLLDDVKDHAQLSALVGELDWLGPGSRIIVTSRRCDVLRKVNGAENYVLGSMKEDKAMTLFCKHAFNTDSPPEDFKQLATDIVAAIDGLPLALENVGEFLYGKSKKVWTEKLNQLKEAPDESVREAFLKIYTTLNENEQNIFLDIACLFSGMDKRIPYHMWLDLQFYPTISISSLCAMSLVEIGEDKELRMHDIPKNFGQEIVKSENKNEPCLRSRLWNHEEALEVLIGRKGTKSIEALRLEFADGSEGNISFECDQFDGLQNLRFLKLDRANIQGNFGDRLSNLRWLDWQGCPKIYDILLLDRTWQNFVILDLSWSQVDRDWTGWRQLVVARKLKVLKLTGCVQLTATPTFPASMELERLILEGCSKLAVIDSSFRNLKKLVFLNMKGCSLLRELPDLGPLTSLKELVIDGTSISQINFQEGSMMKLKTLSARDCKDLTDISDSIRYLNSLKYLSLDGSGIHALPESIGSLKRLKTLSLKNCQRLTDLPDGIRRLISLQFLDLSYTAIKKLPASVEDLKAMKVLKIRGIIIQKLPETILNMEKLVERDMSHFDIER